MILLYIFLNTLLVILTGLLSKMKTVQKQYFGWITEKIILQVSLGIIFQNQTAEELSVPLPSMCKVFAFAMRPPSKSTARTTSRSASVRCSRPGFSGRREAPRQSPRTAAPPTTGSQTPARSSGPRVEPGASQSPVRAWWTCGWRWR